MYDHKSQPFLPFPNEKCPGFLPLTVDWTVHSIGGTGVSVSIEGTGVSVERDAVPTASVERDAVPTASALYLAPTASVERDAVPTASAPYLADTDPRRYSEDKLVVLRQGSRWRPHPTTVLNH